MMCLAICSNGGGLLLTSRLLFRRGFSSGERVSSIARCSRKSLRSFGGTPPIQRERAMRWSPAASAFGARKKPVIDFRRAHTGCTCAHRCSRPAGLQAEGQEHGLAAEFDALGGKADGEAVRPVGEVLVLDRGAIGLGELRFRLSSRDGGLPTKLSIPAAVAIVAAPVRGGRKECLACMDQTPVSGWLR